jgi:hypothetical protein
VDKVCRVSNLSEDGVTMGSTHELPLQCVRSLTGAEGQREPDSNKVREIMAMVGLACYFVVFIYVSDMTI